MAMTTKGTKRMNPWLIDMIKNKQNPKTILELLGYLTFDPENTSALFCFAVHFQHSALLELMEAHYKPYYEYKPFITAIQERNMGIIEKLWKTNMVDADEPGYGIVENNRILIKRKTSPLQLVLERDDEELFAMLTDGYPVEVLAQMATRHNAPRCYYSIQADPPPSPYLPSVIESLIDLLISGKYGLATRLDQISLLHFWWQLKPESQNNLCVDETDLIEGLLINNRLELYGQSDHLVDLVHYWADMTAEERDALQPEEVYRVERILDGKFEFSSPEFELPVEIHQRLFALTFLDIILPTPLTRNEYHRYQDILNRKVLQILKRVNQWKDSVPDFIFQSLALFTHILQILLQEGYLAEDYPIDVPLHQYPNNTEGVFQAAYMYFRVNAAYTAPIRDTHCLYACMKTIACFSDPNRKHIARLFLELLPHDLYEKLRLEVRNLSNDFETYSKLYNLAKCFVFRQRPRSLQQLGRLAIYHYTKPGLMPNTVDYLPLKDKFRNYIALGVTYL